MNFKQFFQKWGAYILALILFLLIAAVYCFPAFEGKILLAGDNVNGTAATQESVRYHKATGEYTWWTNSMFCGMPNYQIGGGHTSSEKFMQPLRKVFYSGLKNPAFIIFFYLVCFFILLRSFDIDKWLSIVGAIAIALSSYFIVIIMAGHGGKTVAISYITLVAAGFYLIFRKKYAIGAIFTMFFTCIGFSIHPQMSYYLFMMIGIFFLAELWIHIKEKRWKDLGKGVLIFALALLTGLGTGSGNIFANKEYAEQTMRGGHSDLESDTQGSSRGLSLEYATEWSYGIDESLSFMIPGVMGGSTNAEVSTNSNTYKALKNHRVPHVNAKRFCENVPLYWGGQLFTAGNVYMGAIVCFLFILGCLTVKGPYKWALLSATLFSVMLAWGSNFMWLTRLFFDYFPLYNKFRAVSSILIVAEITMPLLGFLALKQVTEGTQKKEDTMKSIILSASITGGICLIMALFGSSIFTFSSMNDERFVSQIPDWLYDAIIADRAALLRSDSFRSFIFIALSAALLALFTKGKLKKGYMIAILGVLIIADMYPVDRRYFNDRNFVSASTKDDSFRIEPYEEYILQDTDPHFRVLNVASNTFNEARTSYRLESIGGYSAAKLRRYQDMIDYHISRSHMDVISMLNAKYVIMDDGQGNIIPVPNPDAMGNAWFVDSVLIAQSPNDEIEALSNIDLHTTAVTDSTFASFVKHSKAAVDSSSSITITDYNPKQITYRSNCNTDATAIFSEIYYPYGWKASIDGSPVEHFRANYTLRALNIPAGSHEVIFTFDPDSIRKGNVLSIICFLIMYATTIALIARAIINRRKTVRG